MKILFAASEAAPFLRSGGLGDVAGALPKALAKEGADVRVIMPYYSAIPESYREKAVFLGSCTVELAWRRQYAGVFSAQSEGVTYYFIDNEYYFKRKELYGCYDDGERFAFFSSAILQTMEVTGFYPDVLHCNDWQTALAPLYLDAFYRGKAGYADIKTVLTIHNIEYQGKYDTFVISDVFGIPEHLKNIACYNGDANMLKAGIESANAVTTVSQTYSRELMDPYFAHGLDVILKERAYKLKGIINGIDTGKYNPLKDKALSVNYSAKSVARKAQNKAFLQKQLGLEVSDAPLMGMVTRLTGHKGLDLVTCVLQDILNMGIQMVILGTGEKEYEIALRRMMAERTDNRLRVKIEFSEEWASRIYAGADIFLMPSKSEPCGLAQLIALRYGAIPIVRRTGGLADTVQAFDPTKGEGNGFDFVSYNAHDMLDAVRRAKDAYYDKDMWKVIVQNAMKQDYSWKKSAKLYKELYKTLT
ncbi:MAG: glycogen synthase GlgA [Christensenellales bacterium]|jgi:starch synthase